MLRQRLFLAFGAMAAVTILMGAISLYFVDRVGNSVATYADVTSPLQTKSADALSAAQNMRDQVLRGIAERVDPEVLDERLAKLDEENRIRLRELRASADRAGLQEVGAGVQAGEEQYASTLRQIIDAERNLVSQLELSTQRRSQAEASARATAATLLFVAEHTDGLINKTEEKAKVDFQTGRATVQSLSDVVAQLVDLYPRAQNTRKLTETLGQIEEAGSLLMRSDAASLAAIEKDVTESFRVINVLMRRLQGRLRGPDGTEPFSRLQGNFAALRESLLGPDGLVENRRKALQTQERIALGRSTMDRLEREYLDVLTDVRNGVVAINDGARATATTSMGMARTAAIVCSILAALGALFLTILFVRRIGLPLTRLAKHAAEIRETGVLTPLPEDLVSKQYDEIEKLSLSFNAMVAELQDSRIRLIEWSEGEIRTHYDRLNVAINNMPLGLCMFDAEQKLIICNQRYAEIYHLDAEMTQPGTALRDILRARIDSGTYAHGGETIVRERLAAIQAHKPWFETNKLSDGHTIAVSHRPMANGGSVATHEDVTERRKAEERIAHMAHHDALTDLPNRVRFREEMTEALHRVGRGESLAVLCIDLDHFKEVNDTLGHPIGDALLKQIAGRLLLCIRPGDSVARLGGDEFAIIQCAIDEPVAATALARRIIKDLGAPFDVDGHQVVVGASVGIAISPNDGDDADQLLKKADMALYRAKDDGRATYRFFEEEMDARMQRRRKLELDLRRAVLLGEFELYYQPLITLDTDEVSGCEALLRWHHPERGIVAPDDFIPLAEEIGLISEIGNWVLRRACADAVMWPSNIRVTVNLSPVQFKTKTLLLNVVSALADSGLDATRLELEITETVLLHDTDATVAVLNQLKDLGVRIAMDDFGTGYSSLGYLRKFPFDTIKIDRSFIHDLSDNPESFAVVRAVAGLGATLGMSTTAEGVETKEQLQRLRDEGCTEVQGFLFSRPKPIAELQELLNRPRSKAVA